jgi:hypothetical protein
MIMQLQNQKKNLPEIPEYYLYWSLGNPRYIKKKLRTTDGKMLEIINLGQRNLDNGPDYKNATLKIGGIVYRGDIEFHLRVNDWFAHGHHYDTRYNNVILHVLWHPPTAIPDKLQTRFDHFILSRFLNCSPSLWCSRLSSLAQPSFAFYPPRALPLLTCSQAENLAWVRFIRKCDEMLSLVQKVQWETALYMGLARALGYLNNSKIFSNLIRILPPAKILSIVPPTQRSPMIFWYIYLYQSGLLDQILRKMLHKTYSSDRHVLTQLNYYKTLLPVQRQQLHQWNFSRLRPNNNPYYRLAGYAQIFYHYHNQSLFQAALEIFSARSSLADLLKNLKQLFQLLLHQTLRRALLELSGQSVCPASTMGEERCLQFILNILLPLMYIWAENNDNPGFQLYIEDLYFNFPGSDNTLFLNPKFHKTRKSLSGHAYVQQAYLEYFSRQNPK